MDYESGFVVEHNLNGLAPHQEGDVIDVVCCLAGSLRSYRCIWIILPEVGCSVPYMELTQIHTN